MTGHPGGRDPVGRAERLWHELSTRVEALVAPAGDAAGEVYVGWFSALDAAGCAARFRDQGEEGWGFPGWSPPSAGPVVARAALQRHLDADRPFGAPAPLPDPLVLVREWMKGRSPADRSVGGWVAERRERRDAAALAATAATATRWLAGFLRVMGWPLPDRLALLRAGDEAGFTSCRLVKAPRVTVASGADARLGKQVGSGDFAVVVHRHVVGDDDRLADRAAFEAVAAALYIRIVPARVVVTAGDTGEYLVVHVDDQLLDVGADLVAGVVEQRVEATRRGWAAADATPSPGCRHCHLARTCPPGAAWLAGPGRWRGGLPRLPSAGPEPCGQVSPGAGGQVSPGAAGQLSPGAAGTEGAVVR